MAVIKEIKTQQVEGCSSVIGDLPESVREELGWGSVVENLLESTSEEPSAWNIC